MIFINKGHCINLIRLKKISYKFKFTNPRDGIKGVI